MNKNNKMSSKGRSGVGPNDDNEQPELYDNESPYLLTE